MDVLNKHGNDAADALARKAAATHALPPDKIRAAKHRFAVRQSVQQMMVAILTARAACKPSTESSSSSPSTPKSSVGSSTSSTESDTSDSSSESDRQVVIIALTQVSLHSGGNHPT